MAPKVAKRKQEEEPEEAEGAKKAKEEEKPKEEKYQEPDAKTDSRSTLQQKISFETPDTTLNVVQTLGGKLLTSLTEGGMNCFLAGARSNVGQKTGRYMFEAKILETRQGQGGNKESKPCLRIGFSASDSSLLLGEEGSVCFDNDGSFYSGKKRQQLKGNARINSHQVAAVVLNLDSKSPNFNTIALYRDGAAVGEPMPIPDELKDKPLFPHVTFRNVSVATNFGPTAQKELPFKCRLMQGAAASDVSVAATKEPKDGKYEVMMPVGFPDEGTFDWLDTFLEKNPQYVELSDRKILKWAQASGMFPKGNNSSNDKPNLSFNGGQDGMSLRKVLNSLAPVVPRNYLIMEVKSNLVPAERKEMLKKFNYPCYKKVAHVVMGEPTKDFKALVQNKLLKDKQHKADVVWKAKKAEATRKKAQEERAKALAKVREDAEKKRKAAKEAKEGGDDKKEEEKEEPKEEEEAKVEEEEASEPPAVELDDAEKKVFFMRKTTPDVAPNVLSSWFGKFATPDLDEGFDDVRYEWLKGQKAADYLKKWVMEKKLTTRVDDIKPGQEFKEKTVEFEKLLKGWKEKLVGKKAGTDVDVDIFTVDDVNDAGKGVPLFGNFTGEDWMLAKLRFEYAMLIWSFKKDTNDPDRVGIPTDHVSFYFNKYFNRASLPKTYGMTDFAGVLSLIKDTASTKDGLLVSQLTDDLDNLDIFVKLTEEARRERTRRIEAGDETARLQFTAPVPAPKVATPAPKADAKPAAKLGATAAPKAAILRGHQNKAK